MPPHGPGGHVGRGAVAGRARAVVRQAAVEERVGGAVGGRLGRRRRGSGGRPRCWARRLGAVVGELRSAGIGWRLPPARRVKMFEAGGLDPGVVAVGVVVGGDLAELPEGGEAGRGSRGGGTLSVGSESLIAWTAGRRALPPRCEAGRSLPKASARSLFLPFLLTAMRRSLKTGTDFRTTGLSWRRKRRQVLGRRLGVSTSGSRSSRVGRRLEKVVLAWRRAGGRAFSARSKFSVLGGDRAERLVAVGDQAGEVVAALGDRGDDPRAADQEVGEDPLVAVQLLDQLRRSRSATGSGSGRSRWPPGRGRRRRWRSPG